MACCCLSDWNWSLHNSCVSYSYNCYKQSHLWPTYDMLHIWLKDCHHYRYKGCPISPGPYKRELGYLTKYGKCKEGKVVANHVFPISSVWILYYDKPLWHYTLDTSVIKCYGDAAMLTCRWNNLVVWPTVAKCSKSVNPHHCFGIYQHFGRAYCLHLQHLMGPSLSSCVFLFQPPPRMHGSPRFSPRAKANSGGCTTNVPPPLDASTIGLPLAGLFFPRPLPHSACLTLERLI
jgi:hypothetical protein